MQWPWPGCMLEGRDGVIEARELELELELSWSWSWSWSLDSIDGHDAHRRPADDDFYLLNIQLEDASRGMHL